jgi:MYXO-CTERM domain-containing protein
MRKFASRLVSGVSASSFAVATFVAASASAHIKLIDPPPRYVLQDGSDNGIKSCPCGLGGSNRVCNVAADGSDPDRSERVSRFEAGSTITLRFQEFVNHAGRFRVAFDPDGADMADFNDNILSDVPDPANASGMMWEIPVTLPEMTCDNCTIQLVQAMEVDQNTPIADPAPISSYYSCVDVQLVAPGSLGGDPDQPPSDGEPDDPGMPGDDTSGDGMAGGDMPDDMTGDDMTGTDDGSSSGSQSAGNMSGTPLIPVGSGPSMDATGSMGSGAASSPTGAVAPPGGAVPGAGMAQPLPPLGDPRTQSSSAGGCSLPAGSNGGGALGFGVFGLFALLGLRRRNTRARS